MPSYGLPYTGSKNRLAEKIMCHLPEADTLVDAFFGGGAGNLLAAAIKAGFDPTKVYGIEIDEDILKIAQSRLASLGVPCTNIHLGDALNPCSYSF